MNEKKAVTPPDRLRRGVPCGEAERDARRKTPLGRRSRYVTRSLSNQHQPEGQLMEAIILGIRRSKEGELSRPPPPGSRVEEEDGERHL